MDSEVEFVAVDFPQANRITVHNLATVAEHEASMIAARTKATLQLQTTKARGVALGGQRGDAQRVKTMSMKGTRQYRRRAKRAEKRNEDLHR